MSMRCVIFTGTRAEFGLLQPVARALEVRGHRVEWLVSGMHLLPEMGSTVELVRADPAPVLAEVPYFHVLAPLASDFGLGVGTLAKALTEQGPPDWLVVLGDRHETFACALAASFSGIPIAHLHGGDRADSGHMDECFRHALTRFAHLHLPASERSAARIAAFGEEPWRIHMVGAPGIDRLRALHDEQQDAIQSWLQTIVQPFLLVILHPNSAEAAQTGEQARCVFGALDQRPEHKLAVFPNNDPGHRLILDELEARQNKPDWTIVPNLPGPAFVGALAHARAMVGNSSSGFIEAPYFGLPMLHTGQRNLDREQAGHVRFVPFDSQQIVEALDSLVTQAEHERIRSLPNPYGNGHAGAAAVRALEFLHGDTRLLRKLITF